MHGIETHGFSMARVPLTDVAIRKLMPPPSGTTELWDGKVAGFGIRASAGGARSFVLLYRIAGRSRRLTLGRYPTLSLLDARRKAQKALAELADGVDPARQRNEASNSFLFESVAADFIQKYARPKNKDWAETERLLSREFSSQWARRDIRELERGDVTEIIDSMVKRGSPGAAVHALAAVRRLFGWTVERGLLPRSPVDGLRPPAKIKARDRVLTDRELVAVWNAAQALGYPFGTIAELLIRSGQRRGEVTGLRWPDLHLDDFRWSLPAEANKSGRPHEVPLTADTVRVLDSLPRLHDVLVFPAHRLQADTPVSGHSKAKRRLDDVSGVTDWTLHDIRRTVATGMAQVKVPPHVIERVLNHASGTFAGVAGVYNRFGYLEEMREALDAWEHHLYSLL
jgi:integrase